MWRSFQVGDEQVFVKASTRTGGVSLLLSDLRQVWQCEQDAHDILSLCAQFNPAIEMATERIVALLNKNLSLQQPSSQYRLVRNEDDTCTFHLKAKVAMVFFLWRFHCSVCDTSILFNHIVEPLIYANAEFLRQLSHLEV
jgi:hypothetical protein